MLDWTRTLSVDVFGFWLFRGSLAAVALRSEVRTVEIILEQQCGIGKEPLVCRKFNTTAEFECLMLDL